MSRTYTKRDRVWMAVVQMEPDEEFQVQHILELLDANRAEDESSISEPTVRGVLRTMIDGDLLRHTSDGKWFVRNF